MSRWDRTRREPGRSRRSCRPGSGSCWVWTRRWRSSAVKTRREDRGPEVRRPAIATAHRRRRVCPRRGADQHAFGSRFAGRRGPARWGNWGDSRGQGGSHRHDPPDPGREDVPASVAAGSRSLGISRMSRTRSEVVSRFQTVEWDETSHSSGENRAWPSRSLPEPGTDEPGLAGAGLLVSMLAARMGSSWPMASPRVRGSGANAQVPSQDGPVSGPPSNESGLNASLARITV